VSDPVRVLIADDHPIWREGIRRALEGAGFEVCGEAGDGQAALEGALRERPDLCLLDVHMPGGGGIHATSQILEHLPETMVVMLTVSSEDIDLFNAIRAGASGYLLKNMDPALLPGAVRSVLDGEVALAPGLGRRLVDEFRQRQYRRSSLLGQGVEPLSEREWEVLELLREGLKTAEVADRLGISQVTVRRHVGAAVRKLGVPDRAAAVRLLDERSSP
jgi:DNA-binding NarL/FixJ family response regulator